MRRILGSDRPTSFICIFQSTNSYCPFHLFITTYIIWKFHESRSDFFLSLVHNKQPVNFDLLSRANEKISGAVKPNISDGDYFGKSFSRVTSRSARGKKRGCCVCLSKELAAQFSMQQQLNLSYPHFLSPLIYVIITPPPPRQVFTFNFVILHMTEELVAAVIALFSFLEPVGLLWVNK